MTRNDKYKPTNPLNLSPSTVTVLEEIVIKQGELLI